MSVQSALEQAVNTVTAKEGALADAVKQVVSEAVKPLAEEVDKLAKEIRGHEAAAEPEEASTVFCSVEAPDGGEDAGAGDVGVDRGATSRCEQQLTVPIASAAVAKGGGRRRNGAG